MGKKRDEANKNIEWLVEMLVRAEREALGNEKCPYDSCKMGDEKNCDKCKEEYFRNLQNAYLVSCIVR